MMEEDPGGRVRWGVSGNFGWHIPQSAFTLGASGRVGYQISNLLAAYAEFGGTVGFGIGGSVTAGGTTVTATLLSYYYFAAIAEFMFGNIFYVGGGPVLANGALVGGSVSASANGSQATSVTHTGLMPGLDVRLGLGLGRQSGAPSFRRGGFNLGVNAMILLHPNTVVVRGSGSSSGGTGSVQTNELTVTVVPMFMLGYDSR